MDILLWHCGYLGHYIAGTNSLALRPQLCIPPRPCAVPFSPVYEACWSALRVILAVPETNNPPGRSSGALRLDLLAPCQPSFSRVFSSVTNPSSCLLSSWSGSYLWLLQSPFLFSSILGSLGFLLCFVFISVGIQEGEKIKSHPLCVLVMLSLCFLLVPELALLNVWSFSKSSYHIKIIIYILCSHFLIPHFILAPGTLWSIYILIVYS